MEEEGIDRAPWPERAFLLAGLGAAAGLAIYFLLNAGDGSPHRAGAAWAAFLAASGIALAVALERVRWAWSAAFAAAAGLLVAIVAWSNGAPDDCGAGEGWQFASAILAVALALPLFQAARDRGRFAMPPATVLSHAWTDLILGAAAGAFVLAAILLTLLLAALFGLIGIDLLERLVENGWLLATIVCGAFGGATGLLRDREAVIGILQRVVRAILSVLAPALALGLVLFVATLPFTGLEPLWERTKATTPILLAAIIGAIVLANAVIGNRSEEEVRGPALRAAAASLAIVILPLGLVAALSTGKRIAQYGFTPDRLWAAIFVAAALAFAISYLAAMIRGRGAWGEGLRRANVRLALGLSALALFLALPIVSFGAISARDQLARLESGRVTPDRFDWAAMRFDFGPAGRRALERLARSGPAPIRARAAEALRADSRWHLAPAVAEAATDRRPARLLVTPPGSAAPAALAAAVTELGWCGDRICRLALLGEAEAVLLGQDCDSCPPRAMLLQRRPDGSWAAADARFAAAEASPIPRRRIGEAAVEVRVVPMRQVFVDGKPVGALFD